MTTYQRMTELEYVQKRLAELRAKPKLSAEDVRELDRLGDQLDGVIAKRELRQQVEQLDRRPGGGSGGAWNSIRRAGFDLIERPAVAFDRKALTNTAGTDLSIRREGGLAEVGVDNRYLYPSLPQQDIGDALKVEAVVETSRTLASGTDMLLDPLGSAAKPASSTAIDVVDFPTKMIATVSGLVPNALFSRSDVSQLVDNVMSQAFREALDEYVVTQIEGEADNSNPAGADLLEKIRAAQTIVQAKGFNPTLVAVSPTDAQTIDLYRGTSSDQFILDPAPRSSAFSPLWGMRIVVSKLIDDPLMIDQSVVTLYVGAARFAVDPYTGFTTNRSQARLEAAAAFVTRNADGLYRLGV